MVGQRKLAVFFFIIQRTKNLPLKLKFAKISVVRSKNSWIYAAKEKLEIVSGAAPPPFRIFAGGLPRRLRRRKRFGLIQVYKTFDLKEKLMVESLNSTNEQFNPDELYRKALEDHPDEYRSLPESEVKALITEIAEEIKRLEEVGEKEKARIEMPPETAKKIGAIWVNSGVGTYDTPLKEKERGVYKDLPWMQWADRARLNHAAILARKVAEARSGENFDRGSLASIKERKAKIKEMISRYGPKIICNGSEIENDSVAEVLAREGTIIPEDAVTIIQGTAEHPIVNTLDTVKTLKLPPEFRDDQELAIVAHAPHLARIMRMINKQPPFPRTTKVRLFPVPTPEAGKKEYAELEILGILNYALRKGVADKESYPYVVNE